MFQTIQQNPSPCNIRPVQPHSLQFPLLVGHTVNAHREYQVMSIYLYGFNYVQMCLVHTLLARRTHGIGDPSGSCTLVSRSCFHLATDSNVLLLVTSKTMNAPTASLQQTRVMFPNLSWPKSRYFLIQKPFAMFITEYKLTYQQCPKVEGELLYFGPSVPL